MSKSTAAMAEMPEIRVETTVLVNDVDEPVFKNANTVLGIALDATTSMKPARDERDGMKGVLHKKKHYGGDWVAVHGLPEGCAHADCSTNSPDPPSPFTSAASTHVTFGALCTSTLVKPPPPLFFRKPTVPDE